jgi:hypothetical protein
MIKRHAATIVCTYLETSKRRKPLTVATQARIRYPSLTRRAAASHEN